MRIVLAEMQKIWRPKMLTLVAAVAVLFYLLFMGFHVVHFPNGHSGTEFFELGVALTENYGPTLEATEFEEFVQTRDQLIAEAETYIRSDPVFAAAGIFSWEDYTQLNGRTDLTEAQTKANWRLLGSEYGFIHYKMQTFDFITDYYRNAVESYERLFVLLAFLCGSLFRFSFTRADELYRLTGLVGVEPIAGVSVLLAGLLLALLLVRRERTADIQ